MVLFTSSGCKRGELTLCFTHSHAKSGAPLPGLELQVSRRRQQRAAAAAAAAAVAAAAAAAAAAEAVHMQAVTSSSSVDYANKQMSTSNITALSLSELRSSLMKEYWYYAIMQTTAAMYAPLLTDRALCSSL
jgi:hypothetical protein